VEPRSQTRPPLWCSVTAPDVAALRRGRNASPASRRHGICLFGSVAHEQRRVLRPVVLRPGPPVGRAGRPSRRGVHPPFGRPRGVGCWHPAHPRAAAGPATLLVPRVRDPVRVVGGSEQLLVDRPGNNPDAVYHLPPTPRPRVADLGDRVVSRARTKTAPGVRTRGIRCRGRHHPQLFPGTGRHGLRFPHGGRREGRDGTVRSAEPRPQRARCDSGARASDGVVHQSVAATAAPAVAMGAVPPARVHGDPAHRVPRRRPGGARWPHDPPVDATAAALSHQGRPVCADRRLVGARGEPRSSNVTRSYSQHPRRHRGAVLWRPCVHLAGGS